MPAKISVEEFINESNAFSVVGFMKERKWISREDVSEVFGMDREGFVQFCLDMFAQNDCNAEDELTFTTWG